VFKVDEAQAIFPLDTASYISKYGERMGTQDRKNGVTLVVITQYPHLLNSQIVAGCDIMFVAKIDTNKTAEVLQGAGVTARRIKIMRQLPIKVPTPFTPKEPTLKTAKWDMLVKGVFAGDFYTIVPRSACFVG
jgi:hypothetical protein